MVSCVTKERWRTGAQGRDGVREDLERLYAEAPDFEDVRARLADS